MTLYEQIKDSYDKSYEYIGEEPEFDSGWRAAISYILEDIISKHDCIPDRDQLEAILADELGFWKTERGTWAQMGFTETPDKLADAIIDALKIQGSVYGDPARWGERFDAKD